MREFVDRGKVGRTPVGRVAPSSPTKVGLVPGVDRAKPGPR